MVDETPKEEKTFEVGSLMNLKTAQAYKDEMHKYGIPDTNIFIGGDEASGYKVTVTHIEPEILNKKHATGINRVSDNPKIEESVTFIEYLRRKNFAEVNNEKNISK